MKTTTPETIGMIGKRAGQQPGNDQRDRRGGHEQAGGDEDRPAELGQRRKFLRPAIAARIGEEEHQQRAELQHQLEQRIDAFLVLLLRVGRIAFEDGSGS